MPQTSEEPWYEGPVRVYPDGDIGFVVEGMGVGTRSREVVEKAVLEWKLNVTTEQDLQGWSISSGGDAEVEIEGMGRQRISCVSFQSTRLRFGAQGGVPFLSQEVTPTPLSVNVKYGTPSLKSVDPAMNPKPLHRGHGAALLGDLRRRQGGREISSYDSRPGRNCCLAHPTSKGVKNATSITIAAIIQSPSTRR